jgi:polyhydroxyalkanoate synthesis regulator phasin
MATTKPGLSLRQVRVSMKRMQTEGERLVGRIRRDAQALAARSRRETVTGLLRDARKLQDDLRRRAERAIEDIDGRRARVVAMLEEQGSKLVEAVVKRLNVATREDVQALGKRLHEIERRLDALIKAA